jgi:hypothetical protein
MIRDVVKYLALFVVFLVLILDAVAVIQTQVSVREQASDAADVARSTYVETGSEKAAKTAAESYLLSHDSRFLSATIDTRGGRDSTVASVTAERSAKTFVYKYLVNLPLVGERVDNALNPTAIGQTDESNI